MARKIEKQAEQWPQRVAARTRRLQRPYPYGKGMGDDEINGDKASDASKFLHKRLVGSSHYDPSLVSR